MSLQTALKALVDAHVGLYALIANRFTPDKLEQKTLLPAVKFQVISRPRQYQFGVAPTLSHPRVQIDGYATTDTLRAALAVQMRSAFQRYSGTIGGEEILDIRIDNEFEGIELLDTNTQARRITMDLIIDLREPTS